jgi:hypothetical protein
MTRFRVPFFALDSAKFGIRSAFLRFVARTAAASDI